MNRASPIASFLICLLLAAVAATGARARDTPAPAPNAFHLVAPELAPAYAEKVTTGEWRFLLSAFYLKSAGIGTGASYQFGESGVMISGQILFTHYDDKRIEFDRRIGCRNYSFVEYRGGGSETGAMITAGFPLGNR